MSKHIRKDPVTQRNIPHTNKLTEHHYANLFVRNTENKEIVASYSSTQNLPLLGHQQDFEVLITRLKIPMSAMPLFLFEENEYRIGLGVYQVSGDDLQYETTQPENIEQVNNLVKLRPHFTPNLSFNNDFERGVYSYSEFLRQVNFALLDAWIEVFSGWQANISPFFELLQFNGIGAFITNGSDEIDAIKNASLFAPYFKIDECCNKITFVSPIYELSVANSCIDLFDANYEATFLNPGERYRLRVTMSPKLYSFFNGFSAFTTRPNPNVPADANIFLNHDIDYDNNIKEVACVTGGPTRIHTQIQDQPSLFSWQKASRILIGSTMSIVKEAVLIEGDSGAPSRLEVLTDYAFEQDNTLSNKEYIYFNDQGAERWYNIKDEGPLRRFDFNIYVEYPPVKYPGDTNAVSRILPLLIEPGQEVNVKMKFRRKKFNETFQISDEGRHSL